MVVVWSDWKRYLLDRGEMQCQGNFKIGWLKEEINFLAAKFPPRRPPYCLLWFSRHHNARVILTVPLSEMYATVGSAIAYDRLRLYGNNFLCDRLRSAIRDRLRSSAIIWKPTFSQFQVIALLIHSWLTNESWFQGRPFLLCAFASNTKIYFVKLPFQTEIQVKRCRVQEPSPF